ncbi:MAG: MGMT family protein [Deltaproteobacteria bacterium]|jgi:methylated-DNA-protein-cysteine methyltransferase-like protein|nr:MGMT family protein [Deltaproteobacteria bacterium]
MKFFERVYAVVALIPPGKVMTYGQISQALDNQCSARYVGYAMRAVPKGLGLPCHRVVNRLGELAPRLFGDGHRAILEAEGASFTADGRLDLDACRFWPDADKI